MLDYFGHTVSCMSGHCGKTKLMSCLLCKCDFCFDRLCSCCNMGSSMESADDKAKQKILKKIELKCLEMKELMLSQR